MTIVKGIAARYRSMDLATIKSVLKKPINYMYASQLSYLGYLG